MKPIRMIVFGTLVICLAAGLCVPTASHAFEILIKVSPSVLNLESSGKVVTVHTDIAYGDVVASTVFLNNVEIDSWKADDRGNFVAKFVMEDIKDLPFEIDQLNTFTLIGLTKDNLSFWGSEEVLIVDNIPKGE